MSPPRERNAPRRGPAQGPRTSRRPRPASPSEDWIWGWHAACAALANPARGAPQRLLATPERARQLEARFGRIGALELADSALIARQLPTGAVHQGIALRAAALPEAELADFAPRQGAVLLVLDQVTDPQNVGAILRSAAAFGAVGVVLQERHAPRLTGALAKAAAGALESTPIARVVNLSRALEALERQGWRTVGLAGEAERTLEEVLDGRAVALVLGSEGEGVRRLVAEHCDAMARIPMPGGFESLNVSAAAAIALYEAARSRA